ncbi:MAG: hypothetical protein IPO93_01855 [Actinobacteria bacterium]|jgi:hypothetical protein|nr:hypothetical protein [Actinomycetota bacterium]
MELFLRQQFELLLQEATGNFTERIVHRCGGPDAALERLTTDPEGDGVFRSEFVTAFFEDNLLENAAGHAFVLEALERRTVPADPGGPVGAVLSRLARAAFADVLTTMTAQLIQRQQIYS